MMMSVLSLFDLRKLWRIYAPGSGREHSLLNHWQPWLSMRNTSAWDSLILCPYRRWVAWRAKIDWRKLFMSSWTGWRWSSLSWSTPSGGRPSWSSSWTATPPWESCTTASWAVSVYTLHMMEHTFYRMITVGSRPGVGPKLVFHGRIVTLAGLTQDESGDGSCWIRLIWPDLTLNFRLIPN